MKKILCFILSCLITHPTHATILWKNNGSIGAGTTSIAPSYPGGLQEGDVMVLAVVEKNTTVPTTPDGWTFLTRSQGRGGSGAAGVDIGSVTVCVYIRIATAALTGSLTVSAPSGNSTQGIITSFRPDTSRMMDYDIAVAGDNDGKSTSWVATSTDAFNVTSGDSIFVVSGVNIDTHTFTSLNLTQTGVTYSSSSLIISSATTQGNDSRILISTADVLSGSGTSAPQMGMTSNTFGFNNPAGATVFLRLRENARGFNFRQSNASSDADTVTLDNVGTQSLVVLYAKWETDDTGAGLSSVTDGTSNFTLGTNNDGAAGNSDGQFAYLFPANYGNKTYTVTFPTGYDFRRIVIMEFPYFRGLSDGVLSMDQQSVAVNTSALSDSGNITTTGASELVLGGYSEFSSGTNFNRQINGVPAEIFKASVQSEMWANYFSNTFTGSAKTNITASQYWAQGIISFKIEDLPPASGGGGNPRRVIIVQ